MPFSMPSTAFGLTLAALAATQVLTASSLPPGQPAIVEPAPASTSGEVFGPAPGERYSDARDLLESRLQTVADSLAANTVSGTRVDEARLALGAEVEEAASLTPSALVYGTSPRGFLTGVEEQLLAQLKIDLSDLDASFDEWQRAIELTQAEQAEEQARQAAEAQRVSDRAAARPGAGAASTTTRSPGAAAPASGFSVTPVGTGGQGLIDACAGPVWWTPSWYPYLAEHWHCGGSAFPRQAGAIITIAGSGTYQSAGVVKQVNAYIEDMTAVPAGYDVYYQTCLNNNPETAVIIGLTRIG